MLKIYRTKSPKRYPVYLDKLFHLSLKACDISLWVVTGPS